MIKVSILTYFLCLSFHYVTSHYQIFGNRSRSVRPDFSHLIFDGFIGKIENINVPDWFYIFPGTKWCGAGNVAENDNDFGAERDTDKCCQKHDYCPDIIGGHQTKYNLTNPNFYTRLNCECDQRFYECLKSVNTMSSNQIGQIYFTGLGTQCFKEDFPIDGCDKYTYFPKQKCLSYELDETKEKKYQWFDLQNF